MVLWQLTTSPLDYINETEVAFGRRNGWRDERGGWLERETSYF